MAVADYVLTSFLPTERELVKQAIEQGADAAQTWLEKGLLAAMNQYSK
jgi:peptidyl-tRNA hydrolase